MSTAIDNKLTLTPEQIMITRSVLAKELQGSLFAFLREFWPIVCDKPLVVGWHIEYLCRESQALFERILNGEPSLDLVINIPPGSTKSTILSVMLPAWVWTRKPSFRIITSSWENDLAMKSARLSRDIISSPKYMSLFPHVVLRDDMSAVSRYGTTAGGLRIITSTKASPTGEHADLAIIDDPIGKSQVVSEAMREQAVRHMEALSSRRTDKVVSSMVMVMQRLHPKDPTEWMLSHADRVKHICLPAELSDLVRPAELRENYTDGLLDPVRLSREALSRARRELGSEGYGGEFEQNPQLAAGLLFPREELVFANLEDYAHLPVLYSFAPVDPADKGGDFFSAPICEVVPFGESVKVLVRKVIFSKDGLQICCARMQTALAQNRVEMALIEANGLGIAAVQLLKDRCGATEVLAYNQGASKMVRILSAYEFIKRTFIFDANYDKDTDYTAFIENLIHLTKDGDNKNDDSADALSAGAEILKAKYGEDIYYGAF